MGMRSLIVKKDQWYIGLMAMDILISLVIMIMQIWLEHACTWLIGYDKEYVVDVCMQHDHFN